MKILLVDDHIMFREGLGSLLKSQPDIDVVGEAGTVRQAIQMAIELGPDVVLMDYSLPDGTGLDAVRPILQEKPGANIVFLTIHDEDDLLFETLRSGAKGFLLKNLPSAKLVAALRAMQKGEAPLSRRMTASLVEEFAQTRASFGPSGGDLARLSLREMEIMDELTSGATNEQIAARLYISETTVKNHVHNILHKLGLRNRQEVAQYALQHRLGRSL